MSGGRVLEGAICTQVANKVEWKACAETAKAKVTDLEALFVTREAHMQEKTARALA